MCITTSLEMEIEKSILHVDFPFPRLMDLQFDVASSNFDHKLQSLIFTIDDSNYTISFCSVNIGITGILMNHTKNVCKVYNSFSV